MATKWPTVEEPATARIKPTAYGTLGIHWENFEAMERRGGYSGPYSTVDEAQQGVADWAMHWDCVPGSVKVLVEE